MNLKSLNFREIRRKCGYAFYVWVSPNSNPDKRRFNISFSRHFLKFAPFIGALIMGGAILSGSLSSGSSVLAAIFEATVVGIIMYFSFRLFGVIWKKYLMPVIYEITEDDLLEDVPSSAGPSPSAKKHTPRTSIGYIILFGLCLWVSIGLWVRLGIWGIVLAIACVAPVGLMLWKRRSRDTISKDGPSH